MIIDIYTRGSALSLGNENIGPIELGLVGTIAAASILMAGLGEGLAGGALEGGFRRPWFAIAVLTALLSGVGDYGLNASVVRHNVHTTTLAIYLTQLVACAALALTRGRKLARELVSLGSDRFHLVNGFQASLAMSLGAVACYAAFAHGPASLVTPISSASPVFAVLLARAWLKEDVSMGQFTMVLVIVASLAGLTRWDTAPRAARVDPARTLVLESWNVHRLPFVETEGAGVITRASFIVENGNPEPVQDGGLPVCGSPFA